MKNKTKQEVSTGLYTSIISKVMVVVILVTTFMLLGWMFGDTGVSAKEWDAIGGQSSGGGGVYSKVDDEAYNELWGWVGTFLGIVSLIVTIFLVFQFLMAVKGYSTSKDNARAAAEKQKAFNVGILAIISGFVGMSGIAIGMGIIDFFLPK